MKKSYKFRIYPTQQQIQSLRETQILWDTLWNVLIRHIDYYYKTEGKKFDKTAPTFWRNLFRQQWKKEHPEYDVYGDGDIWIYLIYYVVTPAMEAFFRRVKAGQTPGFPKFKHIGKSRVSLGNASRTTWRLKNGKLYTPTFGYIKIIQHRQIEGRIKTSQIIEETDGKWFVVFSVDNVSSSPKEKTGKAVGIDIGVIDFLITSDREHGPVEEPDILRELESKIRYLQRYRDRHKKNVDGKLIPRIKVNGRTYRELTERINKLHAKLTRVRQYFHFQVANHLTTEYDEIKIEDYKVGQIIKKTAESNLPKKTKAAIQRSHTRTSPSSFIEKLKYVAERSEKELKQIDPKNTTQECSKCHHIQSKKLTLDIRWFVCEMCGHEDFRDRNSADVILQRES